jgi:hypothetical protein
MTFLGGTITVTALTTLIVEIGKKLGWVKGDAAILVSATVGLILTVINQLAVIYPGIQTWGGVILAGVLAGLAAAGLYDGAATIVVGVKNAVTGNK